MLTLFGEVFVVEHAGVFFLVEAGGGAEGAAAVALGGLAEVGVAEGAEGAEGLAEEDVDGVAEFVVDDFGEEALGELGADVGVGGVIPEVGEFFGVGCRGRRARRAWRSRSGRACSAG